MPTKTVRHVSVEGHDLDLTNLDKTMYPQAGFTKAQVIDYYVRVAAVMVPHLRGRPLNLKRYPDGVEKPFFFQKECPAHRPDWLPTATEWSKTRNAAIAYCSADSAAALAWLANLGNLEVHAFLATTADLGRPTVIAFDLDPGPGASLPDCADVAVWVRDLLRSFRLESWVKVSGGKGMQVYVPLNVRTTYEETSAVARTVADALSAQHPKRVTANMRKDRRAGRVLVDWSQNSRHKSTIAVYSLRAQPTPTVSTPLSWDELDAMREEGAVQSLRFAPHEALARVAERGDLFAPVLTKKQRLPALGA